MESETAHPQYPALLLRKNEFAVIKEPKWLEVVYEPLVKPGYYKNGIIVDSEGDSFKVKELTSLGGHGRFWGYHLFYPRRVRAKVELERDNQKLPLSELKARILSEFTEGSTWASRDDFEELNTR